MTCKLKIRGLPSSKPSRCQSSLPKNESYKQAGLLFILSCLAHLLPVNLALSLRIQALFSRATAHISRSRSLTICLPSPSVMFCKIIMSAWPSCFFYPMGEGDIFSSPLLFFAFSSLPPILPLFFLLSYRWVLFLFLLCCPSFIPSLSLMSSHEEVKLTLPCLAPFPWTCCCLPAHPAPDPFPATSLNPSPVPP